MTMIYWAMIGLGAFVAIWIFVVIPAERRHHERKLEIIQRQIEKRRSLAIGDSNDRLGDVDDDNRRS